MPTYNSIILLYSFTHTVLSSLHLTPAFYLERQANTAGEVGQDGDGRKGHQHGPDHMTGDPAGDHQEQGAGTVHHFLQVKGHTAKEERVNIILFLNL